MKQLMENWRKLIKESEEENALPQPLPPSEIPDELYHATRPPLLSKISIDGLRDFTDFSNHGAGQHGVATAMACAALGLKAEVYMGYKDTIRQKQNVYRMNMLGSKVHPVKSGSKTLKDAINEAIRDWITNVENTYYLLGCAVGPHP